MSKLKYLAFLPLLGMTACGGGGGGSDGTARDIAPTRPSAQVSGTGFDGLILEGDVAVSGFSGAVVGNLLGTAKTDSIGRYVASVQSPDTPVLISIDGGYYVEEATGQQKQVDPVLRHKLVAVDFYKSGSAIEVSATFFTTLATGLTEYLVHKQGLSTEVAIERAYAEIDAWAGFDTRRTVPLAVNDAANASPLLTNALKAGFVAAGISELTRVLGANAGTEPHSTFYSIGLIQVTYEDIKADGILNGRGKNGDQLSYGTLLISADTYRTLLSTRLLQFVNSDYNQTGLEFDDLVSYARELNTYNGELFNSTTSPDIQDVYPSISRVLPGGDVALSHVTTLRAEVTDTFGIRSVQFLLNGSAVVTLDAAPYLQLLDLNQYPNGTYQLTTIVTNLLGNQSEETHVITINNGQLALTGTGAQEFWGGKDLPASSCPWSFSIVDTTTLGIKVAKFGEQVLLVESDAPGGSAAIGSAIGFSSVPAERRAVCQNGMIAASDRLNNSYVFPFRVTKTLDYVDIGMGYIRTKITCRWEANVSC